MDKPTEQRRGYAIIVTTNSLMEYRDKINPAFKSSPQFVLGDQLSKASINEYQRLNFYLLTKKMTVVTNKENKATTIKRTRNNKKPPQIT